MWRLFGGGIRIPLPLSVQIKLLKVGHNEAPRSQHFEHKNAIKLGPTEGTEVNFPAN